jgi:hypothetical protein
MRREKPVSILEHMRIRVRMWLDQREKRRECFRLHRPDVECLPKAALNGHTLAAVRFDFTCPGRTTAFRPIWQFAMDTW